MRGKTKKEVSCRILTAFFFLLKKKGIELEKILDSIPYSKSYLLKRSERIEWSVFCKIISNMRNYFSPQDFEEAGVLHVKQGFYPEGVIAGFIFFSSNKISRILNKQIMRIGKHMVSCINSRTEYPEKNKIRVVAFLDQGYEFLPEMFIEIKGTWNELGRLVGHKNFKIDLTWVPQGAAFNISWEKEGFIFRVKRGIQWLFSMKKAFMELSDSHQQLLEQYDILEESRNQLEKQTRQHKTVYDITRSIQQSQDIKKTLKAITDALVNNTGLSSARLRLFKDSEGTDFDLEAFSGISGATEGHLNNPIIINDEKIGELIFEPENGSDSAETDELIEFLLPVINISIHDLLVFRTLTDYKNNLERKVETRTSELQQARDQLSGTIHLLQDIQLAQNNFFTNISHEFRTPLTLILGLVKQITDKTEDYKIKEDLNIVYRNAKKLLILVNQLLDISKIESGNMKLQTRPMNAIPYLKALVFSFVSYAERKKIRLIFNSADEEIIVHLDTEKIEKIITNVLSNAIKFTAKGGQVEVTVKLLSSRRDLTVAQISVPEEYLEISVKDSGIGIPPEKIQKIFNRFYQVDGSNRREREGTGIGLALTKELVELHKGSIRADSIEGEGTTFIICIPLLRNHLIPEEILGSDRIEEEAIDLLTEDISPAIIKSYRSDNYFIDKEGKKLLLIVEDNTDVRNYIKDNMKEEFRIIEAADGEAGLRKAFDHIPDLIISDLMMPKMDGIELCNKLKSDLRTSHIPLIMLTARATKQDKIEGFITGADDYILKPFETDVLKARVKNLIDQRKRIHEYFKKRGIVELNFSDNSGIDKEFLTKVFNTITENICNADFNVEVLADRVAVHRVVLYRKLISLIGESPVEIIKRIRLKKAMELMENKFGNISEVAYKVGFSNPSYFSRCFRKEFGIPPSHYPDRLKNGRN
jgi:signal transduction histidine kinase/DNA-binding NarL/FixJ family response regulator